MKCPRCRTGMMPSRAGDVEIERCRGCDGIFLDRGELDKIAQPHAGDLEYSTLDSETFVHEDTHRPIVCPACGGGTMKKVEFIIYTNIILDYCGACGGFWLDGPELERIRTEVRRLDEAPAEGEPAMLWFARFVWSLPR